MVKFPEMSGVGKEKVMSKVKTRHDFALIQTRHDFAPLSKESRLL